MVSRHILYGIGGFLVGLGIQCVSIPLPAPESLPNSYKACIEAYRGCEADLEEALATIDELNAYCTDKSF